MLIEKGDGYYLDERVDRFVQVYVVIWDGMERCCVAQRLTWVVVRGKNARAGGAQD